MKIWEAATKEIEAAPSPPRIPKDNPVYTLVAAGAAGNWIQVRSLAGMKGVVANSKGQQIPRPIRSSFREGLSVLEYFINTHSARKGLADTALRTAESGYLTRRLVDVSQDVIVREEDCGTERGVDLPLAERYADGSACTSTSSSRPRCKAGSSRWTWCPPTAPSCVPPGTDMREQHVQAAADAGVTSAKVRSVLTCEAAIGTCAVCYGRSMATGALVDVGEAVGIVAAQSIGEPGTQLTMRTFHTGAASGSSDITQGLPRVQELFEARVPKGKAPIADAAGRIRIEDMDKFLKIIITPDDGSEEIGYDKLPKTQRLATISVDGSERLLVDGDQVEVGQQLLEGNPDPHEVLRVMGPRQVQLHLVREVQEVYRSQGVSIHDKHIEVIIRQMLRRVTIIDSGSTEFLPGAVDRAQGVRGVEPPRARRGRGAGRRPARADGHHQGVAGHRVVAVRGLVPGDHPGAHRRGDQRQVRPPRGAQGERDHRQADPRRHRHRPVPRHRGAAHRRSTSGGVLVAGVRRHLLRRGHLRGLRRRGGAAGRLRHGPRLPVVASATWAATTGSRERDMGRDYR